MKETAVLIRLLLLFLVVPFVELVLLLYIAELTDWRIAIGLVVVTGIAGSLLARSQGIRVFHRIRSESAAGRVPAEALLDALMIFVAGALLLTPGVLTDLLGFALLIPASRKYFRVRLTQWFRGRFGLLGPRAEDPLPPRRSDVIDSYVVRDRPAGESPPDRIE